MKKIKCRDTGVRVHGIVEEHEGEVEVRIFVDERSANAYFEYLVEEVAEDLLSAEERDEYRKLDCVHDKKEFLAFADLSWNAYEESFVVHTVVKNSLELMGDSCGEEAG